MSDIITTRDALESCGSGKVTMLMCPCLISSLISDLKLFLFLHSYFILVSFCCVTVSGIRTGSCKLKQSHTVTLSHCLLAWNTSSNVLHVRCTGTHVQHIITVVHLKISGAALCEGTVRLWCQRILSISQPSWRYYLRYWQDLNWTWTSRSGVEKVRVRGKHKS